MGILDKITKEYLGDTVREEDVQFRWSIDEKYKTRDLTDDEVSFLTALARYTLILDKSLFFQIENLQRHTELVLSGGGRFCREFPYTSEIEKEIAELDKLIKDLEEKFERGKISPYDGNKQGGILYKWRKQREKLEEALKNEEMRNNGHFLLGEYLHNNGDDSKVILYVDNIDNFAVNSYPAMLLMGHVLLHEYFHSFYYHVGPGVREVLSCAEEPMAEYGSMVMLNNVASSWESVATIAKDSLEDAKRDLKHFQKHKGTSAAYGFGAYLFDAHKEDYPSLIARYANISRLLDNQGKEALEYKYMLYPNYPLTSRNHNSSTWYSMP